MITLYRNKKDAYSDILAEQLEELVVAHKIIVKEEGDPTKYNLPYLQEGETIIDEKDEIEKFLKEFSSQLTRQRKVSGDACYIDPETGTVC